MRRALLLPLLPLAISCSKPSTDRAAPGPSAATRAAAVAALPSAVNTEPLDPDAPAVAVAGDQVLVDGVVVGDVKAIREAGRAQKIDGEFAALKAKREAWRAAHPGAPFPGMALLRMPRETKALVVKSVFQTAAYAGYPNLSFVVAIREPGSYGASGRTGRVDADAQIPRPPSADPGAGSVDVEEKTLYVRLVPDKPVTLTWRQGPTVISVTEVPWRAAGLAFKLTDEWSAQHVHADVQDKKLDQAIVQADDTVELGDVVAAIDALNEPKRTIDGADVSAFHVSFSLVTADTAPAGAPARDPRATPKTTAGPLQVSGRLPPEVIQRIVRQNFGRFRQCYENGLKRDPKLEGKVSVRFVIGRDGAVGAVSDLGSDLPDPAVKKCILAGFSGLSFPQPEGGIVTVVYPLTFNPG
jgi:pyruvate/2-oxoglutarate dehydrogenase complex dihydrolipoamide acyltransferase (E2) component